MSESERRSVNANSATPTGLSAQATRVQRGSGQRRKEEFEGVLERANRAVRQIAESKNSTSFYRTSSRVGEHRIDITDKVIKALEDLARASDSAWRNPFRVGTDS